jgi:hypothetical protein
MHTTAALPVCFAGYGSTNPSTVYHQTAAKKVRVWLRNGAWFKNTENLLNTLPKFRTFPIE